MNNRDKQETLVRFLRSHVPGVRVTLCQEKKEYRLLETGGVQRYVNVGLDAFGIGYLEKSDSLVPIENGKNLVVRAFEITNQENSSKYIKEWLLRREQELEQVQSEAAKELLKIREQKKIFGAEDSKAAVKPLLQRNLFAPSSQPLSLCQLLKKFLDVVEVSQNLTTFQFMTLHDNHDEVVQKLQKIDGIDPPQFAIAPRPPHVYRRASFSILPSRIVTFTVTLPEFFIESLFKANNVKMLTPKDFLTHAMGQELGTMIPSGVLGITSDYVGNSWQDVFDALSEAPKNQPAEVALR